MAGCRLRSKVTDRDSSVFGSSLHVVYITRYIVLWCLSISRWLLSDTLVLSDVLHLLLVSVSGIMWNSTNTVIPLNPTKFHLIYYDFFLGGGKSMNFELRNHFLLRQFFVLLL